MSSAPRDPFWENYMAAQAAEEAQSRKTKWVEGLRRREQLSERWAEGNRTEQLQADVGKVMTWLNIPHLTEESECQSLLKFTLGLDGMSKDRKKLLRTVDSACSKWPPATGVLGKLTRSLSDSFTGRELSIDYMTADNLVQATLGIPNRKSADGDDGYETAVERVGMIYTRAEAYGTSIEERNRTTVQPSSTAP